MDRQKRTWAEIDLDNIRYNYRSMRAALKPTQKFLGVVKADAYGHGAVKIAEVLEKEGADYLAVACIDEAVTLRNAGIKLPILILGITDPKYTDVLVENNITQAVGSLENAAKMSEIAVKMGKTAKIHLKVDSGMGRVGFTCHSGHDPLSEMVQAANMPNLDVEGIFTHFAVSDELGDEYTNMQFDAFCGIISRLEEKLGRKLAIHHCTNSGAMINYDWAYMDMVRPGIALYGCYPAAEKGNIDLKPVMQVKSRIAQIKDFEDGNTISYGRTYTVKEPRKIAIVPIGYADGLHRVLSGRIEMLVCGKRVKQVGRICMDMCMIDVTDVPEAKVGDIVTVFGRDGDEFIPIEEQAEKAGTI
ncbi:MAG: alanine racemase, partial [Oscillospiraceae bacterium]|nr:alanine racemase [Oscillospiraceae bacterium]